MNKIELKLTKKEPELGIILGGGTRKRYFYTDSGLVKDWGIALYCWFNGEPRKSIFIKRSKK